MLTVHYAKAQPGITFNAIEPGTTPTDMTAAFGIGRPIQARAGLAVHWATLSADGPTGTFQDEAGRLPW
jgi:NAD(P)-dependent dehydrogenase (short-subunit alcohol dehydrogenase family)